MDTLQKMALQDRHSDDVASSFGNIRVLDDLIRQRAADTNQLPILAYPRPSDDGPSYDYFSGRDLDRMIETSAHALVESGLKPVGAWSPP